MSSGASDMNLYALFQALSLVMGTVALFYTMKNVGGAEGVKFITEQLGKMATKVAEKAFEGLGNLIM